MLTIGSFLLTVELFYLQLTILAFLLTVGAFLLTALASLLTVGAFLLEVYLIRALRDCKQRSLTVSKNAPTVSKKLPPFTMGASESAPNNDVGPYKKQHDFPHRLCE